MIMNKYRLLWLFPILMVSLAGSALAQQPAFIFTVPVQAQELPYDAVGGVTCVVGNDNLQWKLEGPAANEYAHPNPPKRDLRLGDHVSIAFAPGTEFGSGSASFMADAFGNVKQNVIVPIFPSGKLGTRAK